MAEYVSTRDPEAKESSYSDVLLQGLAPDRGLYMPNNFPQIDESMLRSLQGKTYVELFTAIKSLFIGDDIAPEIQRELAENAYSQERFPNTIDGNVAPAECFGNGFWVQDLSEGPTFAFKDMALGVVAQYMQYLLEQRGEYLTILGATSGDTGSSAEAANKDLERIMLFMLSPKNGAMTPVQSAQMAEQTGGNIFNISITEGGFDECQQIVKDIKMDPEFSKLGAVNSINWGRIASQVPYYVSGYLQVIGNRIGDPIDVVVPTGNFGNILSAYIAREMGVPIRRLIVATNENNVVDRLIQTGTYDRPNHQAAKTTSPSMDITVASNFERLAYRLFEGDPVDTKRYMEEFERTGQVSFSDFGLPNDSLKQLGFDSDSSTARDRIKSIQWAYFGRGKLIDPHTADAVTVAIRKRDPAVPILCMSTALPVKFEKTMEEALGFVPPREERLVGLEERVKGGFDELPYSVEAVKNYIRERIQKEVL